MVHILFYDLKINYYNTQMELSCLLVFMNDIKKSCILNYIIGKQFYLPVILGHPLTGPDPISSSKAISIV